MNTITLVLVGATALTGIMWLFDVFCFRKQRKKELKKAEAEARVPLTRREKNEILESGGIWGNLVSCFPVLLAVLLVRSFLYEPFRIPSASMMPTLVRGDFILIEKFRYGFRNPFTNKVFYATGTPARGDVVVFKFPEDPSIDYIKRIVGLPGDRILVSKGQLYIQEKGGTDFKPITARELPENEQLYLERNPAYSSEAGVMGNEDLLGVQHRIMRDRGVMSPEPFFDDGTSNVVGNIHGEWLVPEGHYFVMGDNREHSRDSRYWGFVPEDYLLGRAVAVWFSCTMDGGVRIDRIGGIN